jgi:hypothetical protein
LDFKLSSGIQFFLKKNPGEHFKVMYQTFLFKKPFGAQKFHTIICAEKPQRKQLESAAAEGGKKRIFGF